MELQPVGVCGPGSAWLMMRFDHPKNLFQPEWIFDSTIHNLQ